MLVERKRRLAGGVGNGDLREIARFHFLNAALDLADAFQIIGEHGLVGGPENALQILGFSPTMSSSDAYCFDNRARSAALSPWPNKRMNSFRGSISIGRGVVGVRNEIVPE